MGHFVHLVGPDRFAARLLRFVDNCVTADGERPLLRT
jgi:hypothetical protein